MFKKVWETLQLNAMEKSDKDKNVQRKKTTRLRRLYEKGNAEDRTSSCNEHLSSDSESSSTYADTNIQIVNKNKRVRTEEPKSKSNVKKLNIDFSLVNNINFDDFDH